MQTLSIAFLSRIQINKAYYIYQININISNYKSIHTNISEIQIPKVPILKKTCCI